MKLHRLGLTLCLGAALVLPTAAEQTATVTGTRVNVRGQASLQSEVVTQLNEGDVVTILEEVQGKSASGEPTRWARIKLPSTTTVFVFAPYVDASTKAVKVSRLNVRGGPGEQFSVVGRLSRGTTVKEVQTTASWMEIEAPETTYAYVSMSYLQPQPTSATTATTTTAPTPPPVRPGAGPADASVPTPTPTAPATGIEHAAGTDTEAATTVTDLEDPQPVVTEPPSETAQAPTSPPTSEDWPTSGAGPNVVSVEPTVPTVEPEPAPADTPRRVVIREGRVVVAFSPHAPTRYGLMSLETRRLINYLHSEVEGLNLKAFAGRDVFVTGEELLDARWVTPLIDVEDIRLAPAP